MTSVSASGPPFMGMCTAASILALARNRSVLKCVADPTPVEAWLNKRIAFPPIALAMACARRAKNWPITSITVELRVSIPTSVAMNRP
jgi:hypothetical protein